MNLVARDRRLAQGALVGLAVFVVLQLATPDERTRTLISDVTFVVTPLVAAAWIRRAGRLGAAPRRPVPLLLSLGCVVLAVANVVWGWYEVVLGVAVPQPSLYDLLYTSAYLLLFVAIGVRLVPLLDRTTVARATLDGAIVAVSLLCIGWSVLGDVTGGTTALTWLYPALDVVGASLAFTTMTRVAPRSRGSWLALTVAFMVLLVTDCSWAYGNSFGVFTGGQVLDVLWPAGYLLIGYSGLVAASSRHLDEELSQVPLRWELLLPYGPVCLALVMTAVDHVVGAEHHAEVELVALGLGALVVARQVLTSLENHKLTESLEALVHARTLELASREEHFRSLLETISDLVVVLGPDDGIRYQSPAVERTLGYSPDQLRGSNGTDFVHPDDLDRVQRLRREGRRSMDVRIRRSDGTWAVMDARFTDLRDHPEVGGVVLTLRDVAAQRALEERLRYQAYHDQLTTLANRRCLQEHLDDLVATGRRPALVLLDLDGFKAVNDTAGHELGDDVLRTVAERLRRCTRGDDLVARLGGDEFAIVVDDPSDALAEAIVERVLDELARPLHLQGRVVRCGASAGLARVRDGGDSAQVLRDADVAMYVAKANGKRQHATFTDDMHRAVVRRGEIEERLRDAVARDRLVVHYQPLVSLLDGTISGVEALVRLDDGQGGIIEPAEFLDVAEETGLMTSLGEQVLGRACAEVAAWQHERPDGPPLGLSVNLSVRQLREPDLVDVVVAALQAADLPAGLLTLEITEGALADDGAVDATLLALRRLGVRLSIDDFGAGYSSFARLRDFPVDELKIDRTFVEELRRDDQPAPIVAAVLRLADTLGLDVVAEGIERPEQAAALTAHGCRVGQGFWFGRPVAPEAIQRLLRQKLTTMHSRRMHELL